MVPSRKGRDLAEIQLRITHSTQSPQPAHSIASKTARLSLPRSARRQHRGVPRQREHEGQDESNPVHKTISLTITVHYPFHPHHGRQLEVLLQPRHGDGAFTVIDPSGKSLKVPAWMTYPAAAQHQLSPVAAIDVAPLLALAQLLEPIVTELRTHPPANNSQPRHIKHQRHSKTKS